MLRDRVSDLECRVQKAQANVKRLDTILVTWVQKPIFERRDGKKDTLLNLEDKADRLTKAYVCCELLAELYKVPRIYVMACNIDNDMLRKCCALSMCKLNTVQIICSC